MNFHCDPGLEKHFKSNILRAKLAQGIRQYQHEPVDPAIIPVVVEPPQRSTQSGTPQAHDVWFPPCNGGVCV